ncbi:hypothetical protein BXP70_05305 [Hymenobacter crusticola]|uniref:Uncharacterized protein n=1 Tax=Hymenobacter crusticola TaxID=1770526 RepID=A0A243WIP7_9BACT|nr:hypothetical protein BXP70_05305 [Hymenobacter crusticola]
MRFSLILFSLLLSACIDLDLHERHLVGPYYLAQDPVGSYETLFYRLSGGLDAERVSNVYKAGYTEKFVFVEAKAGFYCINRRQDRPADLGDLAVQQSMSGPLNHSTFTTFLRRIGEASFSF